MQVGELFVVMGLDMSQYDAAMKQAEKKANTLGGILRNALSFTLGMGLFEAIKQGFKAVVGEAVNFNSMMEQARIGFATMLGSAERAQAFLNDMANFAKDTPFELPELLEASKNMMAMGFSANEVLPTLKAVGDAAAGLGVGSEGIQRIIRALTQMRAKSKVSAEEMLQLAEVGVPAWEILAEHMGTTTAETMKLAERGLIPANEAIQALIDGMEKRFPNMMAKMQNTWQGITSAIRDIWRMTIGSVTEELFKSITAWLGRIRDAATNFYNVFSMMKQQGVDTATALKTAISYAFGEGIGAVASMIINAVQGIWQVLVRAAVIIRTYWDSVRYVLLTVLSALFMFRVVFPIINGFITLTNILNGSITATSGLFGFLSRAVAIYRDQLIMADLVGNVAITTFTKMRYAIYALYMAFGKLGLILLSVSAILGIVFWAWSKYTQSVEKANIEKLNAQLNASFAGIGENLEGVGSTGQQVGKSLGKLGDSVAKAGKKAKGGLAAFDEIHQVMSSTAASAENLAAGMPAMPELTAPAVSIPKIDVGEMFNFEMQQPTIKGFLQWLWGEIKNTWNSIVNWIKGTTVWQWLVNAWNWVAENAKIIWGWIKEYIISPLKTAWDWIVDAWNTIVSWLGDVWKGIVTVAKTVWGWVKEHIVKPIQDAWSWLVELWNKAVAWLGERWNRIVELAKTAWNWVKEHIINPLKNAWDWLLQAWNSITTWLSQKWNDIATTAKVAWEWVKQHIINPIKNTWDWLVQVWNSITSWLSSKWNEIVNTARTVWGWIKDNIIRPIQDAWNWLVSVWNSITGWLSSKWNDIANTARTVWDWVYNNIVNPVKRAWDWLISTWNSIKAKLGEIWNSISSKASSIWKGIGNTIIRFINGAIDAINGMIRGLNKIKISFPSWVPLLGGKTLGFNLQTIGHIPYLAEGGIVTSPTLAMIGEAGPEAVVPLTGNNALVQVIKQAVYEALLAAISTARTSGANNGNKEIVLVINGREVARAVVEDLADISKKLGIKFA